MLGTTSKKNKLPFKHPKPQFIGRILSNSSPYLNINYYKTTKIVRYLLLFIILFLPHTMNYKQNKNDNK